MEQTTKPIYQHIAPLVDAMANCKKSAWMSPWYERHLARLNTIMEQTAPSGSGIDNGTTLMIEDCTPNKLVFFTDFHHMNADGYYDGWTAHTITVTPSFDGVDLKISGRDRNDIKDYLWEVFHDWMGAQYTAEWFDHLMVQS